MDSKFDGPGDRPVGEFYELTAPPPDPGTFEMGLVLGGTVSAAAYTAGVLDFLVEALDAWTVAKSRNDPEAPRHNVVLKIVCGTSGGGICAVLLARALGRAFPHCDPTVPPEEREKNPLYRVWVKEMDINTLLQTDDLTADGSISSLLCAQKFKDLATELARPGDSPLGTLGTPLVRDYVEQPLPVVLTLTNLRGISYSSYFRGASGRTECYTDHVDHIRFRVDIAGNQPPAPDSLKPYEVGISDTPADGVKPWSTIFDAARGTSAFPVGLPPMTIERDFGGYLYRYAIIGNAGGDKQPSAVWLHPILPKDAADATLYKFLAVDGGCFNNEPVEFARQWLAGVLGHNDRHKETAHRAIVLVDPFATAPSSEATEDRGLFNTASATLSALLATGRFATADLDLFTEDEVYSRFLINPVRGEAGKRLTGDKAIATSSLEAFGGFLSADFREHDFFLGRRNCQAFLRKHFVLDKKNALFAGWTQPQREEFAVADLLPIIPLFGELSVPIEEPKWPDTFDPEVLRDLLQARIAKLAECAVSGMVRNKGLPKRLSWLLKVRWLRRWVISKGVAKWAAGKVIEIIRGGLGDLGSKDTGML